MRARKSDKNEQLQMPAIQSEVMVGSAKKTPLPHQKGAIKDSLKVLERQGSDIRAQTHMACGTGKTLVGLWVSQKLGDRTLLCEPSLALIAQNLKEWRANYRGSTPDILVVCSDKTTVSIGQDQIHVRPEDLEAKVTTDASEVKAFLKDTSRPKLLLSTYHSLPVLADSMRDRRVLPFSCAVIDEAHRTASVRENDFSLVHYQEAIRSRTRFYLTATPKIFDVRSDSDGERVTTSMDNQDIFGPVSHSLTFSAAIQLGLLSDYRLVVATLTEESLSMKRATQKLSHETLSQLAVLRAIEKYDLSKLLSYHSSVARSYNFANSIGEIASSYLPSSRLWSHGVDGGMPTSVRSALLDALKHNSRKQISIISNCRCLTEGIDVPALDGIVFADPKKSEIDVVQAIGRVIRRGPVDKIGTIIVPLVVPSDVDTSDYLERSSVFKPVAQVLRALKAHDDRFEVRMRASLLKRPDENKRRGRIPSHVKGGEVDLFGLENLLPEVAKKITAKTLKIGFGLKRDPLSEKQIIEAAKEYYAKYRKWPNQHSEEPVPGLPNDSWNSIDAAGFQGLRGLEPGRTLSVITKHLKNEQLLSEEIIIKAANAYFKKWGEWPNRRSLNPVPGLPNESWAGIESTCHHGYRGLKKGRTLSKILAPHTGKTNRGAPLTEDIIVKAAKAYFKIHKRWPSQNSPEPVPGMPGNSWDAINSAGHKGLRGLLKGRTIAAITAPLKNAHTREKLSEGKIKAAADRFFKQHGKWPTKNTKEPVPGMPEETWQGIDACGLRGSRGLLKGQTLSKILSSAKNH